MGFQRIASVDGLLSPLEKGTISVLDRGFLYGDSVYEVFRTYEGVPLLLEAHLDRLHHSADMIGMIPSQSRSDLLMSIREAIHASGAPQSRQDVYVRFHLTRGAGPIDLFPNASLHTSLVILVKEVPSWPQQFYDVGTSLAVAAVRRNPLTALDPNIKSGNYLNNVMGIMEARQQGADDCILLNPDGNVTEASNSNLFVVHDGNLLTPSQSSGILRGLTKEAILSACRDEGLRVIEQTIPGSMLEKISEAFLTSATREVMPVSRIRLASRESRELPAGGGAITRRIAQIYRNYIRSHLDQNRRLGYWAS